MVGQEQTEGAKAQAQQDQEAPELKAASLLFVAALLCSPAWADAKLEFDRFKNQTVVSTKQTTGTRTNTDYRAFSVMAIFAGDTALVEPPMLLIAYESSNVTWRYLKCHDVGYLADGKIVPVALNQHKGDVRRGYVDESVNSFLAWANAKTLAAAKKVEVKVCSQERTLTNGELADLRSVVEAATPK